MTTLKHNAALDMPPKYSEVGVTEFVHAQGYEKTNQNGKVKNKLIQN
jgi:hypothetical protein